MTRPGPRPLPPPPDLAELAAAGWTIPDVARREHVSEDVVKR